MSKVYHLEINGVHSYYTTLTGLCVNNIGVSKFTLDRYDFKEPYKNDICTIRKGVLNSGVKTKLPEIKKSEQIKLPEPSKQTNLKVNILPNTFVIKTFGTFINIDGEVLEMDTKKPYFEHKGKKYNLPKKTFGDIETLLC